MEKLTNSKIAEVTTELNLALMESIEANNALDKIKIRQAKAQKKLSLAKDAVRGLRLDY